MFSPFDSILAFKTAIYFFLRSLLKGFLRRATGLCELQRLCYANNIGAKRTKGVGNDYHKRDLFRLIELSF